MPLKISPKTRNPSKKSPATAASGLMIENLENRTLLSSVSSLVAEPSYIAIPDASNGTIEGFSPSQINTAYGFINDTIPGGGTPNGSGQTIAIVDAYNDPNIYSDLAAFDAHFGLPSASLSVVNEMGSSTALPSTNAGWDLEISMDVEWAHAIAPGANILLVETNTASLGDLLQGVNYAKNAKGVSVVSMSWGSSEFFGETSYDSYFTTPAGHNGVTFIAASGDEGSWYGPDWPAVSSNVLSVGGTTLYVSTSAGNYGSETGWSDSTGGISAYEPEASYQEIAQDTGAETAPDVAYDANPSTGFAVYDSETYEGTSGWWELGGTSSGAPQWAGLIAIADQGRAAAGESTLNGATQTLPLLFSLYTSSEYYDSFRDETSGSSSWYYSAEPGYDAVTGLGSPHAAYLIRELINATATGAQGAVVVHSVQSQTLTAAVDVNENQTLAAAVVAAGASASPILQEHPVTITALSEVSLANFTSQPAPAAALNAISAENITFAGSTASHSLASTLGDVSIVTSPTMSAEFPFASPIRAISEVSGATSDVAEHLVMSSATAFSQTAQTVAARIFERDRALWRDSAALAFAAAFIGAEIIRERRQAKAVAVEPPR